MLIEKFEDIISWQKSKQLTLYIYRAFKNNRESSFRDQIRRATVSISNNIAEGFERKSNKEFRKFLYIAKGSSAEVRSMAYIALDLEYITQEGFQKIYDSTLEISKLLSGLIKTL
jgi:four helix bundle protein